MTRPTFSDFRHVLLGLGFSGSFRSGVSRPSRTSAHDNGCPPRPYQPEERMEEATLVGIRRILDEKGVIPRERLNNLLRERIPCRMTFDPSEIGRTFFMPLSTSFRILYRAAVQFSANGGPQMGAALAYYALFSTAPLLILAVMAASLFVGESAAQAEVHAQLARLLGPDSAREITKWMHDAPHPSGGGWRPRSASGAARRHAGRLPARPPLPVHHLETGRAGEQQHPRDRDQLRPGDPGRVLRGPAPAAVAGGQHGGGRADRPTWAGPCRAARSCGTGWRPASPSSS